MKLNIKPDCGNSPKRELVKNLTIYFASYDLDNVMGHLAENVKWTLVGDEPIVGRDKFRAALKEMSKNRVIELTIFSIVTHGKEAAVNGEMVMQDGKIFGFSDFYEFSSAKGTEVRAITSYIIKM